MKALSHLHYQKKLFLESRKKLFSDEQAGVTPKLKVTPNLPGYSKSSFLFTVAFHTYVLIGSSIGIIMILPHLHHAIRHRKISALLAAMTLYRGQVEATPLPPTPKLLTAVDIPVHPATKLVCHDPWVSFLMAAITAIGVVVYLYRQCKDMALVKGHRFAGVCNLYLIIGTTTRYVPLLIGQSVGSPFLFKYNHTIPFLKIALEKQLLWDHVHLDWTEERIKHREETIPLKEAHHSIPERKSQT